MNSKTELRNQVGQLLIMGFDGVSLTPSLRSTLAALQPSGVILFKRNIEGARQTHTLLRDCRATSKAPMFLCVDMEGGVVDRLKHVIAPAPSAAEVFATGDRSKFRQHGYIIGACCKVLGFNTDFAPVLDLAQQASQTVLGSRAVSNDPKQVTLYAREFLRGLRDAAIIGCGKHFPGLGEGDLDSHHAMPVIQKKWSGLWEEDLYPYRALRRELPLIMVSHASYPAATKNKVPASLSLKWMQAILRRKIDYRGLIISDDLEMGGALAAGSLEDVAVASIRAGADIFLVCHTLDHVRRAYEAVLRAAECDGKLRRRVEESARGARAFKARNFKQRFPARPSPLKLQGMQAQVENFYRSLQP